MKRKDHIYNANKMPEKIKRGKKKLDEIRITLEHTHIFRNHNQKKKRNAKPLFFTSILFSIFTSVFFSHFGYACN